MEDIRDGVASWLYNRYNEDCPGNFGRFYWEKASEEIKGKFLIDADDFVKYLHSQGLLRKAFLVEDEDNRLILAWHGRVREWREAVLERDGFVCQHCGVAPADISELHVHHIDYNHENNNPPNLITLCHNCHAKTNGHREEWGFFNGRFQRNPDSAKKKHAGIKRVEGDFNLYS